MKDDVLGDFAKCTALLAEIDDETDAAALRPSDAFLDRVDEVGLAGANIGTKDIRTVTYAIH